MRFARQFAARQNLNRKAHLTWTGVGPRGYIRGIYRYVLLWLDLKWIPRNMQQQQQHAKGRYRGWIANSYTRVWASGNFIFNIRAPLRNRRKRCCTILSLPPTYIHRMSIYTQTMSRRLSDNAPEPSLYTWLVLNSIFHESLLFLVSLVSRELTSYRI